MTKRSRRCDDPRRDNPLYDLAVALVGRERRVSTAGLFRAINGRVEGVRVGYNLCALLLARMELDGIVGRIDSENRRAVLIRRQ